MNDLIISSVQIRVDGNGRFCLNDLHKAAGAQQKDQPRYWLSNQQTVDLIDELGDSGFPLSVQRGGVAQGTYACKELVYAYAMWISAAFHLKVIRAYDALVSPSAVASRQPKESTLAEKYKAAIPVAEAVVELGTALGWTIERSQAAAVDIIHRKMGVDIGEPSQAAAATLKRETAQVDAIPQLTAQLSPIEQLEYIARRGPELFRTQTELAVASGSAQTVISRVYRYKELNWNPTTRTMQRIYEAVRRQEAIAGNPSGQMFLPLK